jgi:hypothetical protein
MYGALRLRIIGRYVKRAFHSNHHFCNIFGINCYHMFDTEEMTACVVTYLQLEYIHITFVNGIKIRIVVMVCRKSFLCMHTSTNMPINVLKVHAIFVSMYKQ